MKHKYSKAIVLTKQYLDVCGNLHSMSTIDKPSNSEFIQAAIFERLTKALQSILPLVELLNNEIDVENSLGLILRCACADMLVVFYITTLKDEEIIFKQSNRILYGNIVRDKRYITRVFSRDNFFDQQTPSGADMQHGFERWRICAFHE